MYLRTIFDPGDLQHAKDIVITPDKKNPNKWNDETNFFISGLKI